MITRENSRNAELWKPVYYERFKFSITSSKSLTPSGKESFQKGTVKDTSFKIWSTRAQIVRESAYVFRGLPRCEVREDSRKATYVDGAMEVEVANADEALLLLAQGYLRFSISLVVHKVWQEELKKFYPCI